MKPEQITQTRKPNKEAKLENRRRNPKKGPNKGTQLMNFEET